jgi:hypothetical protein
LDTKIELFKKELISDDKSYIVSKWILESTPFIFNSDKDFFLKWKKLLGGY